MKNQNPNKRNPIALTNRNKCGAASLMLLVALLLPGIARASVYHFELQGLNTASDANGNVIAMTGSGRFDTTTGAVAISGTFTTYDSTGAVVAKGAWGAT